MVANWSTSKVDYI